MEQEDLHIRRAMEASDLPKLPGHWQRGDSALGAAIRLLQKQGQQARKWVSSEAWRDWNLANPLVSAYTTMVMVPVGGSFCRMRLCSAGLVPPAHSPP
jgi:hypothetical protein